MMALNIGGLQTYGKTQKNNDLRKFVMDKQVTVLGMSEVNVHWKSIPAQDRLYPRVDAWQEANPHVSLAYYEDFKYATPTLTGGTALLSFKSGYDRAMKRGEDPKGLGRW